MEWQPIETAPKDGTKVFAKDSEGFQNWTWYEFGDWVYTGWTENEDQEEFETDEVWDPEQWAIDC